MFRIGEHVSDVNAVRSGLVIRDNGGTIVIREDGTGLPVEYSDRDGLVSTDSAPGPSYVADIVHEAMLRHARNAGAAVTALEIIRREAKQANDTRIVDDWRPAIKALDFIEKFCDDVLSQVLPA